MCANQLYTIEEAAAFLSCSRRHIYRLINDGSLAFIDITASKGKLRQMRRLRESDLIALAERGTRVSAVMQ